MFGSIRGSTIEWHLILSNHAAFGSGSHDNAEVPSIRT
jgi:hypothetical protein